MTYGQTPGPTNPYYPQPGSPMNPVYTQPVGQAVTKVKWPWWRHAWHIWWTIATCGLWGFVYWAKYARSRSQYTQTRFTR